MPALPTRKLPIKAVPVLWHDSAWGLNIVVTPAVAILNRFHSSNARGAKKTRKVRPALPSAGFSPWRALCGSHSLTSRRASFLRRRESAALLQLVAIPLRSLPASRLQIRHLFQTTGCCL